MAEIYQVYIVPSVYRIRPNYRTVRFDFFFFVFKITGNTELW